LFSGAELLRVSKRIKKATNQRQLALLCAAVAATLPAMASAQTTDWTNAAGDGSWSDARNWDNGVPAAGYTANIANTLGFSQTVTYDYTGAAVTLNTLTVDLSGGIGTASSMLSMSGNAMTTTNEYIGDSGSGSNGVGTFNQSGGIDGLGGSLYLGYNSTDTGFYTLSGTGSLSLGGTFGPRGEYLGYSGAGNFNQSGGTNTIRNANADSLILGFNRGSTGAYTLSGGVLSTVGEWVGDLGAGTFDQSGGVNTNNNGGLFLGEQNGSTGTYTLSGTGSLSAEVLAIGFVGTGNFSQSGGATSAGEELDLGTGPGSSGTYTLSGGSLAVTGGVYVGGSGVQLNFATGGTGVLTVSGSGQLSAKESMTLYNNGRVNINGGSTTVGGLTISGNGIVNMNAAMAINYASPTSDPVSTIVGYLTTGFNGGNWAGTSGIISTSAAASVGQTPLYSVGYADGDNAYDLGKVSGLQPNQILVMYMLAGDANLDGTVNFADLLIVAQNFNKTGEDWVGGNFTYNPTGLVNFADLLIVAQNFNQSLASNASVSLGGNINSLAIKVPEPSALALTTAAAAGLLTRRRRTKSR
jgi:hypothetical protein